MLQGGSFLVLYLTCNSKDAKKDEVYFVSVRFTIFWNDKMQWLQYAYKDLLFYFQTRSS